MHVAVFGCGYVGLVSACGLAELGNSVYCVDVDSKRVALINSKHSYLTEPGLGELLAKHVPARLVATENVSEAVAKASVLFVCVGTPTDLKGVQDLSFLRQALEDIGACLRECSSFKIVVVKSTVLPGTTTGFVTDVLEKASGKKAGVDFGVASNPEFLQETRGLEDFLKPSRLVVGVSDEYSKKILEELYSILTCEKIFCLPTEAELIKYASNSFLVVKLSYANELALMCRKLGVGSQRVLYGVGLDSRINHFFLETGLGWGGSCFPKDTAAFSSLYKKLSLNSGVLDEAISINKNLVVYLVNDLSNRLGSLEKKTVAVLGISFKPFTEDVRESQSLKLIEELKKKGANVVYSDPLVKIGIKDAVGLGAQEAVDCSSAVVIATAWPQFKNLSYGEKTVFDARGLLVASPPRNYVNWS